MGLPKKNFEKKISFPKKCVEVPVWVFDGVPVLHKIFDPQFFFINPPHLGP
jgi:hypothetical protein